jgi:CubicO group peptidase (beta-lactamase class C family)
MGSEAAPPIPSDSDIQGILAERVDRCRLSVGIAVGLSERGRRRFIARGYCDTGGGQPVDGDTVFAIASVTKLFTLLLLSEMVSRGEVALEDPVADYLPAGVRVPERDRRRITLADLATHRSGLPHRPTNLASDDPLTPYANYTIDRLYEFLAGYELPWRSGERLQYSNVGMGLLAHALARHAGSDYETLVLSGICQPLGMTSTAVSFPSDRAAQLAAGYDDSLEPAPRWDLDALVGAGGLCSTVRDLLIFLEALGDDGSPLASAMSVFNTLTKRGAGAEERFGQTMLAPGGPALIRHSGLMAGYRSYVGYVPEWRRGVAVLANSHVAAVADLGLHLLDARHALHWYRQEATVDPAVFDRYVGRYQMAPDFVLAVTSQGDRLFLQATGQRRHRLFPEREHRYFLRDVGAQITFEVGADGGAVRLILHQNSVDRLAVRIE